MNDFTLRPVTALDAKFLAALFRSVRQPMFEAMGLEQREVVALCDMQLRAQSMSYRAAYPDAEYLVIEAANGKAVGRLTSARTQAALVLVDIALHPEHRNRGLGAAVIRGMQQDAEAMGLPLTLTVEAVSPARELYRRLGFEVVSEQDLRCRMRWQRPPAARPRESPWSHTSAK